jgi:hypothetical protein
MSHLRVRLTNGITVKKVIECLPVCRYAYGIEKATDDINPHVHFILLDLAQSTELVRSRLRKLGIAGNGGYSMSTLKDKSALIHYIMKDSFVNVSLTPEEIKAGKDYVKPSQLKNKVTLYEECKSEIKSFMSYPSVIEKIYDIAAKRGVIRRHQIQAVFDTLMCANSKQYRDQFLSKFYL